MDGEVREYSKIADYNPAVLEDVLEKDIRDLMAFLITQSEQTGQPLAFHLYTDLVHIAETFHSRMKPFVPPRYENALNHFVKLIKEIAETISIRDHPSALLRAVLNIARHPIVDRLSPGSPMAYADGNINNSTLRHRVALAKDIWGVDPEMHDVPPGFVFLIQQAFEDPTDRSTMENKAPDMYTSKLTKRDEAEESWEEQTRRLGSPETEKVSQGEKVEEEPEGPEAKTWQERQNEENKEFFEKREAAERINRARERNNEAFEGARRRDEQSFERQRDQAKEAREAQERNDQTIEGRNRANEQAAERQRESDERYRGAVERDSAALENVARSNEDFFKRQEDQASRREDQEAEARRNEEIEANNALAEAIARLEATFGLIREHEEEVGRAPSAASELIVLGGEINALRGLLARGVGGGDLRARAAGAIQRGMDLGAELKRLGAAAGLEAGEGPQAAEGGGAEAALAGAEAAAEAGVEAPGAGAEAEGGPTTAELAEAVAEITGEPVATGEAVPAAEVPEVVGFEGGGEPVAEGEIPNVIEPVAEAVAEETPAAEAAGGEAVPPEEIPEVIEPTEAQGAEAQGVEVSREEIPEVVEPTAAPEPEPEEEPQPSEEESSSIIKDEIIEDIVKKAQEDMAPAETASTIEAPPVEPTEPAEPKEEPAEAKVGGGEEEKEEPAETQVEETEREEAEEVEVGAPGAEGERRAGTESASPPAAEEGEAEPQPSEEESPSMIKDEIVEDIVKKAQEDMAPAETASTIEAPPVEPTEPAEPKKELAEAKAGGGEEEEEEPPETKIEEAEPEEVEARAPGAESERRPAASEAEPPPATEPESQFTQPSDRKPSHPLGEKVKEHIVEEALSKAAQPPSAPPATETEKKTAEPSEPPSAKDAEEPSLLHKIADHIVEAIRPLTSEGAAVRKNETAIKRAGRAQKRIDATADLSGRQREGLRRLQEETGPQARQETEKPEKEKPEEKERTGTGKTGSSSGGRARRADVEKAAEMAVRENQDAVAASAKVEEETREIQTQQNRAGVRKKPALARKPAVAKIKTPPRRASTTQKPAAQKSTAQKREPSHARQMQIKRPPLPAKKPPLPPKKSALPEKRKSLPATAALTGKKRQKLAGTAKPRRPGEPAPAEPAPN